MVLGLFVAAPLVVGLQDAAAGGHRHGGSLMQGMATGGNGASNKQGGGDTGGGDTGGSGSSKNGGGNDGAGNGGSSGNGPSSGYWLRSRPPEMCDSDISATSSGISDCRYS